MQRKSEPTGSERAICAPGATTAENADWWMVAHLIYCRLRRCGALVKGDSCAAVFDNAVGAVQGDKLDCSLYCELLYKEARQEEDILMSSRTILSFLSVILLIAFLAAACGGGNEPTPTPPPPTPTFTPTPAPTPTATPIPAVEAASPESPLAEPESPLAGPESPLSAPESPLSAP